MTCIITNHHIRMFKYRYEVPPSILERDFDWLDEDDTDGFFKYKRVWYHVSEFLSTVPNVGAGTGSAELAELGWDGYHVTTAFSAVVIQLEDMSIDDGYTIGLALW